MAVSTVKRFEFLDYLRFIAAGAVILQHAAERLIPLFHDFSAEYFKFGSFGVTLFFLTSGFIIPVSLEKHGNLKKFWISRVFRLFPLYIACIIITLSFIHFGLINKAFPSTTAILANLSMFPRFLGQPLILTPFWTLGVELIFYFLVSIIFFFKWQKKSVEVAVISISITFLLGVIGTQVFHMFQKGWGTLNNLSIMFVGTVCYRYFQNQISARSFILVLIYSAFVTVNIHYWNVTLADFQRGIGHSFLSLTTAYFIAFILFIISMLSKEIKYPKWVLYMGLISYSLYLIQEIVFLAIPEVVNPYVTLSVWILIIVAASSLTYTFIEKPFIKWGQQFNNLYALKYSSVKNSMDQKI